MARNIKNLSAQPVLLDSSRLLDFATLVEPMRGLKPKPSDAVGGRLSKELQKLLNKPPTLRGNATRKLDGRTIPIAIALVRDEEGRTRPGVLVRLEQDGELKDHTRTNARGIALLRFPRPRQAGDPISGTLEVLAAGIEPKRVDVTLPDKRMHVFKEIVFTKLEEEEALGAMVLSNAASPLLTGTLQDNPLDRLPADFPIDLCGDLTQILGASEDPIFGNIAGATDFRRRRIPLIKRLTIPRIGINPPGANNPPRRYLVRVRQQWTPLGYTLGEIANVDALDPGAIVNESLESVHRLTEKVTRSLDTFTSRALDTTTATLSQTASIDTLLHVATQTETFAAAGGFGFILPPFVVGGGGGYGKVSVNAATTTSVDTSLLVNSSLQVARNLVNQAQRTAMSQVRAVESTVNRVLGQVSPLLSKVTNLLRWTMYENYIVCTHVEDVVEVQAVPLLDQLPVPTPGAALFTDEEVVEYRRIFQPRLLEPRLAPHFDTLARAVALKRAATLPLTVVHLSFGYAASLARGTLTINVDGAPTQFVSLPNHGTRAHETVRLTVPANPLNTPINISLNLSVERDLGSLGALFPPGLTVLPDGSLTVHTMDVRFESSPGNSLAAHVEFGNELRASTAPGSETVSLTRAVTAPQPAIFTEGDPLFRHIEANRHYYYGVLAQAALTEPALRDDARLLREVFPSNHDLWRLPIIGFEGDHALVVSDPDTNLPDVQADVSRFLEDQGAATLIQLAAPGAYAEALEGLLSLTDAVGKLHPQLLPVPAPVLAPVLPVVGVGGSTPLPGGGGGVPLPIGGGGGAVPVPGGGGGLPVPGGGGLPQP